MHPLLISITMNALSKYGRITQFNTYPSHKNLLRCIIIKEDKLIPSVSTLCHLPLNINKKYFSKNNYVLI